MKHYSTYQSQFIEMFKDSPKSTISDFCKVEKGATITRNEVIEGDIPVIAGGQEPSCYHNVANRKAGAITISASGAYSGFVNYWSTPIFASDCNTVIPIDEENTNVHFLYNGLKAMQKEIYALQKGGAQPHVYGKDIEKVLFPYPTKAEQDIFADIAQQADKSKFSNLKSQFIEMFEGDKYPRISLDAIADEWIKGQAFKKDEICENGDKHCIHYGELFTKYGPVIKEVVSKTSVDLKKPSKNGDILFPASDVTPNGLARCSMLPYDNVVLGGDIIVLRPKEGYSPAYLSYAINQQTTQLLARVNGGLVKHLSAKGLKTVEIPIPSKEKQEEYIRIAEQADKSKLIQNTLLNNKLKFCYCYTPRHISS